MRTTVAVLAAVWLLAPLSPAEAAIDRLQKEDGQRFVIGMLNLYYNIGKGVLEYGRDVALGLPKLPVAIATDVFQVGQKKEPEAYYMTEREKRERERQERLERRLRVEEEKARLEEPGVPKKAREGLPSITTIKE